MLQGNYSDLLVSLSAVYSDLRGDAPPPQSEEGLEVSWLVEQRQLNLAFRFSLVCQFVNQTGQVGRRPRARRAGGEARWDTVAVR